MYEQKPVVVELPNTVDLEVTDTAPEIKGATATNQNKPATLETGLVVQVPPFIKIGDVIRVDTRSGEYLTIYELSSSIVNRKSKVKSRQSKIESLLCRSTK